MKISIFSDFGLNVLLFLCLFAIRNVSPIFNATKEVRQVVTMITFSFAFQLACILFLDKTVFVVMGYFVYIILLACIVCLYLTALRPIAQTYETSNIIPFSLNQECLNNFESAIIQETSSRYFYDYLVNDLKEKRGLVLFALYTDLRRFMILCDDKHRNHLGKSVSQNREELDSLAK